MTTVKSQEFRKSGRRGALKELDSALVAYNPDLDVVPTVAGLNVVWKAYPDELPDTFTENGIDYSITWFNNFVVVDANNNPANVKYRVTINKPPAGKRLCVYNKASKAVNKGLREIKIPNDGSDTVTVELDVIDPPTGLFP